MSLPSGSRGSRMPSFLNRAPPPTPRPRRLSSPIEADWPSLFPDDGPDLGNTTTDSVATMRTSMAPAPIGRGSRRPNLQRPAPAAAAQEALQVSSPYEVDWPPLFPGDRHGVRNTTANPVATIRTNMASAPSIRGSHKPNLLRRVPVPPAAPEALQLPSLNKTDGPPLFPENAPDVRNTTIDPVAPPRTSRASAPMNRRSHKSNLRRRARGFPAALEARQVPSMNEVDWPPLFPDGDHNLHNTTIGPVAPPHATRASVWETRARALPSPQMFLPGTTNPVPEVLSQGTQPPNDGSAWQSEKRVFTRLPMNHNQASVDSGSHTFRNTTVSPQMPMRGSGEPQSRESPWSSYPEGSLGTLARALEANWQRRYKQRPLLNSSRPEESRAPVIPQSPAYDSQASTEDSSHASHNTTTDPLIPASFLPPADEASNSITFRLGSLRPASQLQARREVGRRGPLPGPSLPLLPGTGSHESSESSTASFHTAHQTLAGSENGDGKMGEEQHAQQEEFARALAAGPYITDDAQRFVDNSIPFGKSPTPKDPRARAPSHKMTTHPQFAGPSSHAHPVALPSVLDPKPQPSNVFSYETAILILNDSYGHAMADVKKYNDTKSLLVTYDYDGGVIATKDFVLQRSTTLKSMLYMAQNLNDEKQGEGIINYKLIPKSVQIRLSQNNTMDSFPAINGEILGPFGPGPIESVQQGEGVSWEYGGGFSNTYWETFRNMILVGGFNGVAPILKVRNIQQVQLVGPADPSKTGLVCVRWVDPKTPSAKESTAKPGDGEGGASATSSQQTGKMNPRTPAFISTTRLAAYVAADTTWKTTPTQKASLSGTGNILSQHSLPEFAPPTKVSAKPAELRDGKEGPWRKYQRAGGDPANWDKYPLDWCAYPESPDYTVLFDSVKLSDIRTPPPAMAHMNPIDNYLTPQERAFFAAQDAERIANQASEQKEKEALRLKLQVYNDEFEAARSFDESDDAKYYDPVTKQSIPGPGSNPAAAPFVSTTFKPRNDATPSKGMQVKSKGQTEAAKKLTLADTHPIPPNMVLIDTRIELLEEELDGALEPRVREGKTDELARLQSYRKVTTRYWNKDENSDDPKQYFQGPIQFERRPVRPLGYVAPQDLVRATADDTHSDDGGSIPEGSKNKPLQSQKTTARPSTPHTPENGTQEVVPSSVAPLVGLVTTQTPVERKAADQGFISPSAAEPASFSNSTFTAVNRGPTPTSDYSQAGVSQWSLLDVLKEEEKQSSSTNPRILAAGCPNDAADTPLPASRSSEVQSAASEILPITNPLNPGTTNPLLPAASKPIDNLQSGGFQEENADETTPTLGYNTEPTDSVLDDFVPYEDDPDPFALKVSDIGKRKEPLSPGHRSIWLSLGDFPRNLHHPMRSTQPMPGSYQGGYRGDMTGALAPGNERPESDPLSTSASTGVSDYSRPDMSQQSLSGFNTNVFQQQGGNGGSYGFNVDGSVMSGTGGINNSMMGRSVTGSIATNDRNSSPTREPTTGSYVYASQGPFDVGAAEFTPAQIYAAGLAALRGQQASRAQTTLVASAPHAAIPAIGRARPAGARDGLPGAGVFQGGDNGGALWNPLGFGNTNAQGFGNTDYQNQMWSHSHAHGFDPLPEGVYGGTLSNRNNLGGFRVGGSQAGGNQAGGNGNDDQGFNRIFAFLNDEANNHGGNGGGT